MYHYVLPQQNLSERQHPNQFSNLFVNFLTCEAVWIMSSAT